MSQTDTAGERNIYLEDVPLEEAQARLQAALEACGRWAPLPGERVPLEKALGRVTAEPVWAVISSPHYHAAAMDGYAVRASDTLGATLTRPLRLAVPAQAIPVNTGMPLPEETNAVIMIEQVQPVGDAAITIREPVAPWQHVRQMGEDMVATELVLPANHVLRPVDLGAAAGCGHTDVLVRRRPRVALLPTGSELVAPGEIPRPGQVIEYNSLVIGAQIQQAGATYTRWPVVPDDATMIQEAIREAAADHDLVLVLSGSSAGSKDFTARAVREAGKLLVHGVAVRPGHPVIMGIVDKTPVIGVPGYPVSAALTGEIFIRPLLCQWIGLPVPRANRLTATLTHKLVSPTGDDDFVRVTVGQVGDRTLATPLGRGAGVITSLVRADGLLYIPRFSEGLDAGSEVEVLLYRSPDEIARTVVVVGSHDPMLDLLGQFLAVRFPGYRLASANVGSLGGLVAQKRGEAHLSGTHLLDPDTGEYNVSYIRRTLGDKPVHVVTFAHREQGLIVAPGNPQGIESLDDLARVEYVNRQRGAGTRVLLDYELAQRGIDPADVRGYDHEEYTHLTVAAAVASGRADCGMGIRGAAVALKLDFIFVAHERFDLVIPASYVDLPMIQHVLALLSDNEFRAVVAAQPGYDVSAMGQRVKV
ncbi:MAG: molybdopterin biosynthesis protein [Anaerolineae bacterium]|nr:molybdopterin biosynthesis protein [Anaerolineae bacterium]